MNEEWREIAGFDGAYEVSDFGRVRRSPSLAGRGTNAKPGAILKVSEDCNGYPRALLYDRILKKYRSIGLHTAVLEAFVGLRPEGTEASHLNGVRNDGRLVNLKWETRSENHRRKLSHGTLVYGEKHKCSKLKESQVIEIRRRAGNETHQTLADEYGVARGTITSVVGRKSWPHAA